MFFKKKEETVKPELLKKENIKINCEAKSKDAVIEEIGMMLVNGGYVDADYVDAMKKREETFSTFMGNEIAMPHGVEEAKKDIKYSGIAVMIFPNGTDWESEKVRMVVGIAGVGEEHLTILSNISMKLTEPEDIERMVHADVDEIYKILTEEE